MKEFEELLTRGVGEVIVKKELETALKSGKKLRIYLGVDPSGPIIHIGHAIPLRKLQQLQKMGHKIIFMIGDFTGMIGDPTDRNATRQALTHKQVLENAKTYQKQVSYFLNFSGNNAAELRFNSEWNDNLTFRDIVELTSKFTVQQMIKRDMYQRKLTIIKCENCHYQWKSPIQFSNEESLKSSILLGNKTNCPNCGRLTGVNNKDLKLTETGEIRETPIYLHEFLYPIIQAYDAVMLDADMQIGGTDQTFNMLQGRTLMNSMKNKNQMVMTCELLEGTDGRKMSKSFDNFIAINAEPNEMFGKIMSVKDELIIRYFVLATDMEMINIKKIEKKLAEGMNPRDAKVLLGKEIVTMYHNKKAADEAEKAFNQVFAKKENPDEITEVSVLDKNWPLAELLEFTKLTASKSEARRMIEQGGVKVDGAVIGDREATIRPKSGMIIQIGKRKFIQIKLDK